MNTPNFDPKNKLYKSHFGAIKQGEAQRLRLALPEDVGAYAVYLAITRDGEDEIIHEMTFEWKSEDMLFYKVDIRLDCGIYFYHFFYKTENGDTDVRADGGEWQQTVYIPDKKPTDIAGGIIYQIFPDRFFRSPDYSPEIPAERYVNESWGDTPEHTQTKDKKTLGNDFFCGNLLGIRQKLDYIKSLGVTVIYLNPIFLSSSNHRYNTMDYEKIDTLLGDTDAFSSLCRAAHERDIKIIIDGVFSHTGDDSRYFDKYKKHGGACADPSSPYKKWYKFTHYPDKYQCWWGVETLPEIIEETPEYLDYICGENGILRRWQRCGADGWRLDVADELPDVFLDRLNTAVKSENPEAFIIGEVWEDATTKISYGNRRRYLLGGQLDSVMNYPFANAIIKFMRGEISGYEFTKTVETITENYPPEALALLMNHIGTHDTARIINMLGTKNRPLDREWQANNPLTEQEYAVGKIRLFCAVALQYTLPGIPSVFYGDEAGLTGWADPFCRGCYPWGKEDAELLEYYKKLGEIRKNPAFRDGKYTPFSIGEDYISYIRKSDDGEVFVAVNRGENHVTLDIPRRFMKPSQIGTSPKDGRLTLETYGFSIIAK